MYKNLFELQVLVNGKPVKETSFQNKSFIEARRGTQYTLKLKNNSHRRALAVFSVDGIDVLKGNKASEAGSGYVIDSYSSIEIKGFRVDDENVSAFKFDDKKKSYAAVVGAKTKSGSPEKTSKNSGIIGVKVTLEKEPEYIFHTPIILDKPYYPYPTWTLTSTSLDGSYSSQCLGSNGPIGTEGVNGSFHCNVQDMGAVSSASNNMSVVRSFAPRTEQLRSRAGGCSSGPASSPAPNFTLGTTWGEKIQDKVRRVDFETSNETFLLEIYYGERHELEEYGVDFSSSKKVSAWPKSFGESEYCAIPDYK